LREESVNFLSNHAESGILQCLPGKFDVIQASKTIYDFIRDGFADDGLFIYDPAKILRVTAPGGIQ
jgi:hypothetical protein